MSSSNTSINMPTIEKILNMDVLNHFTGLDQGDAVIATYVWLGNSRENPSLRCKSRTLRGVSVNSPPSDFPVWNYDGSSTEQAEGDNSEVLIRPCAIYRDPFMKGNNLLVLCDTWLANGEPHTSNSRIEAERIFNTKIDGKPAGAVLKPLFGLEIEHTLFKSGRPLGFPKGGGFPRPQGPYYCSAGAENNFGRQISDCHYKACLYAGIGITGTNAEVMCGQWEYQICSEGIRAADDAWMARYLLLRVAEYFNVTVSYESKIFSDLNGSGMHTNFSTEPMRKEGGYDIIMQAIKKLEANHKLHIDNYGDNSKRLTGLHETSSLDKFTYGVANRGASVRIPNDTKKNGYGYFEDRRPSSDSDPYIVTSLIFKTTSL